MSNILPPIYLTEQEAACLSAAALFARNQRVERPSLETGRMKLRNALDRMGSKEHLDEGKLYVAHEC